VDQLKRNLQALADRVGRLEATVARMPKITGAVNVGARLSNATTDGFPGPLLGGIIPGGVGFENVPRQLPVPGVVDRDGRFLNNSSSMLERVNAFYDIDLGVTAQISDVATARLLLNAGNYLRGYLGSRISQVNPFIDGGTQGMRAFGVPAFTVENVTPYYLYIETPVKIGGLGTQLTVGKFGHQFTPYTLKMVDVDSYFYNDKTDLGDYPIAGARANFRALNLNWSLYAGVHDTDYAQLTSTAGWLFPGVYNPDFSRFRPLGGAGAFLGAIYPFIGSTLIEQTAGARVTYVGRGWQVGGTYLTGAGHQSDLPGAADLFRQLTVMGVDASATVFGRVGLSGSITQSRWDGQVDHNTQKVAGLGSDGDRTAIEGRVRVPVGSFLLGGYYKNIGDGFDAPGSWGRIGNWINPRGIEGFGGTLEVPLTPISRKLIFEAEGAWYKYNAFSRSVGYRNNADLTHIRAGIRYPLTSRNSIDFGYERVDYSPNRRGNTHIPGFIPAVDRLEQYYNVGFAHQFSPNMTFRLLYQLMNVKSGGFLELPGFGYEANIIATQFQVRF
jgi:hypothetical protein